MLCTIFIEWIGRENFSYSYLHSKFIKRKLPRALATLLRRGIVVEGLKIIRFVSLFCKASALDASSFPRTLSNRYVSGDFRTLQGFHVDHFLKLLQKQTFESEFEFLGEEMFSITQVESRKHVWNFKLVEVQGIN